MTSLALRGSSNTEKAERIKKVYGSIETAIANGEKFVIIEHLKTGFFLQFAVQQNVKEILLDIPLIELSDEQIDSLKILLNTDAAIDPLTGEPISIQKTFYHHELKKASRLVEKIFIKIFNLPKEYNIMVEIFS